MSHNENLFKGSIGRTYQDSQPWWPDELSAPKGAANIVIIVLDDVGFADLGCYGSEIATPSMDRLARGGVRYSNFHVTSMCSPTRACLFTGRNAHAVGMGIIAEWSSGFPGYRGQVTAQAATIPEVLRDHAYGTYAVGKWHQYRTLRCSRAAGQLAVGERIWPVVRLSWCADRPVESRIISGQSADPFASA